MALRALRHVPGALFSQRAPKQRPLRVPRSHASDLEKHHNAVRFDRALAIRLHVAFGARRVTRLRVLVFLALLFTTAPAV